MNHPKELIEQTRNLTILFVEDHQALRENTANILKHFFKEVISASDGLEALSIYKQRFSEERRFDLVLTDIQMPHMNGVTLTEKIYEIYPKQSLIVISAHDESEYLLALINLGIEQFVKKPIDFQELIEVLFTATKKISSSEEYEKSKKTIVQFQEDFTFNRETQTLLDRDKSRIYLTKYEIIFLMLLTENVGNVHSNDDIVAHYKASNEEINPQNIRKLISKLRKKIPEDTLESIYGLGYKINAIL